jgi:hypothetical protein
MAASSASSRLAICSFWTRSEVRVKRARHPFLDQGQADGRREMRLSAARRSEQNQIGAFLKPAVSGAEGGHLGARDHGNGVEGEAVERLSGWQARLGEMPFDPAAIALGDLVLGKGRQQARGRPTLLVGASGELRPDELDRRQAQIVENEAEPLGVDGRVAHAASPVSRTS